MKNRLLITVTALLLAASPLLRAADEPKTPLGEKMEALNTAYKAAKKQITTSAESPETLAELSKAKMELQEALKENLKPKNLALVPADGKAKYLEGYEAKMHQMIDLFGKLEMALKEKKHDAAVALVTEIDALNKESHTAYRAKPKM